MITVNSLSGGKTSSYLAMNYKADINIFSLVCIDDPKCAPADKAIVKAVNEKLEKYGMIERHGEFIATGEDDKVLKVMFDLEQMMGTEIVWVRDASFEKIMKQEESGKVPNMKWRFCTTKLKVRPIVEFLYMRESLPCFMNLGIRYDEENRVKFRKEDRDRTLKIAISQSTESKRRKWREVFFAVNNYPLYYDKVLYHDIQEYWKDKPIDFQEDSNCVGCFWKRVQQLRKNFDDQPLKMDWFKRMENQSKYFFKANISYNEIEKMGLQLDFNFGTGSGCEAGFCTD